MSAHAEHAGHHIVPVSTYLVIFAALIAGTLLTVGAAYYDIDFPFLGYTIPLNTTVALLIAATKAALVVLFFMHVKYSTRLIWVFAAAGFLWLIILFTLTLADYQSRGW
jgi:cytochrome c oxidase subunit 4